MRFLNRILGRKQAPVKPAPQPAHPRPVYPPPPQGYSPQQHQPYATHPPGPQRPPGPQGRPGRPRPHTMSPADQALARYRYMLRTAPAATIEQAHAEAFGRLTPQQRHVMLQQLSPYLTPEQRATGMGLREDPASLARMAVAIEVHRPGTLESIYRSMSATSPA